MSIALMPHYFTTSRRHVAFCLSCAGAAKFDRKGKKPLRRKGLANYSFVWGRRDLVYLQLIRRKNVHLKFGVEGDARLGSRLGDENGVRT